MRHALQAFDAKEVMSFLGRKHRGSFTGEIVTNLASMAHHRIPGFRIKHRVKINWLKMYDKAGLVLRVETVINSREEFRVRKSVTRSGRPKTEWVPMRKGVSYLFRYREVALAANRRYLDALAVVSDPSPKVRELDRLTRRKRSSAGRSAKAFNPLARDEVHLFKAVMNGAHCLRGFTRSRSARRLGHHRALAPSGCWSPKRQGQPDPVSLSRPRSDR